MASERDIGERKPYDVDICLPTGLAHPNPLLLCLPIVCARPGGVTTFTVPKSSPVVASEYVVLQVTMSSISFPHSGDADLIPSSSLRDSMQAQFYTPPGFDVGGSFQMNPLSAHPPRTPRPSTAAQSHFENHTANLYDEKSEATEKGAAGADEDEVDEESERVVEAEKKVSRHEVWRDMLVTSGGRDKAFVRMSTRLRVQLY